MAIVSKMVASLRGKYQDEENTSATLVLITPKTMNLSGGKCRSGWKSPERSLSYSSC